VTQWLLIGLLDWEVDYIMQASDQARWREWYSGRCYGYLSMDLFRVATTGEQNNEDAYYPLKPQHHPDSFQSLFSRKASIPSLLRRSLSLYLYSCGGWRRLYYDYARLQLLTTRATRVFYWSIPFKTVGRCNNTCTECVSRSATFSN
jgi:hypothetical protein